MPVSSSSKRKLSPSFSADLSGEKLGAVAQVKVALWELAKFAGTVLAKLRVLVLR